MNLNHFGIICQNKVPLLVLKIYSFSSSEWIDTNLIESIKELGLLLL